MATAPLPKSFNEVYLEELTKLRPGAFPGDGTDGLSATPMSAAEEPEEARRSEERRAANLADIFGAVHGRLADAGPSERAPLVAICLSGGGIRSATFNLGVLQGLARHGLLGRFDYLSSVSGGGFIAAWLKAWMYRDGTERVAAALTATTNDPLAPEPKPLDRLREYSNYLTPKVGLFSPDSWTAAALIVRNLLLNWLVLLPLLAAVVSVPQLALLAVQGDPPPQARAWLAALAVVVALFASVEVHRLRAPRSRGRQTRQLTIVLGVVVPVYLSAVLLSLAVAWTPWPWWAMLAQRVPGAGLLAGGQWPPWFGLVAFVAVWTVLIPTIGWLLVEAVRAAIAWRAARTGDMPPPRHRGRGFVWELLALILSGILAGALLVWVGYFTVCGAACGETPYLIERPILFVILAGPTLLADYLIARTLFVAIASRGEEGLERARRPDEQTSALLDDFDREWWARLSGWVLAFALGWLVLSALALLTGYLLHAYARSYALEAVAGIGGMSGVLTAVMARSSGTAAGRGTNTASTSRRADISLHTAAPVFLVAIIALLSYGTAALGRTVTGEPELLQYPRAAAAPGTAAAAAWRPCALTRQPAVPPAEQPALRPSTAGARTPLLDRLRVGEPACVRGVTFTRFLVWVFGLLIIVGVLFSRVVNVNRFSLHGLYRNRLVRAYLGASNVRREPDPFTGFASTDNVILSRLWREQPDATHAGHCTRPLPVINTALNLVTGSKRLSWQLRKAESFSMTPFYCGNFHEGYRKSSEYGGRNGITLGTAIAISGAAANPNMGYNSSPAITFLMSLLNARLGAWLGNTNAHGADVYMRPGPRQALMPLVAELFGQTDAEHAYVNLSDGGHFDNLGLYEMVLRRCRYILLSDAGRDPSAGFEDLGNAIRKVRIDFGIPIEFGERIQISPREDRAGSLFCATARIRYAEIDGAGVEDGHLVYIKPALFGRGAPIPYDVLAYSKRSGDFPHESTSDQWFDEAQFESYRALGLHTVQQIGGSPDPDADFPAFLRGVEQYIRAASKT